jgi:cytosine/adenosine deaminase-related metal-dependent hydrolase
VGMSPMQAITAATQTNARVLGWTDTGTLEAGKRADVLIVDGNPLADISVLGDPERIAAVYQNGAAVDRSAAAPRTRMMHEKSLKLTGTWMERARGRGSKAQAAE